MAAPPSDAAGGAEEAAGDRQAGPATQTSAAGGIGDDTPMTPRAAAPASAAPQSTPMGRSPKRPAKEGDNRGTLARSRVSGVAAEHRDDVLPDFLQILRDMDVPDPHDASDSQLIEASTRRALDGLKQHGVGKLVKRSEA
eukprot:5109179-Pyramimonas_sp.AAC.1